MIVIIMSRFAVSAVEDNQEGVSAALQLPDLNTPAMKVIETPVFVCLSLSLSPSLSLYPSIYKSIYHLSYSRWNTQHLNGYSGVGPVKLPAEKVDPQEEQQHDNPRLC